MRKVCLGVLTLLIVIVGIGFAFATEDFVRYFEQDYQASQYCDGVDDLYSLTPMTHLWSEAMEDHGWDGTLDYTSVSRMWLTDRSKDDPTASHDYDHLETFDVAIIGSHGNWTNYNSVDQYRMRMNTTWGGSGEIYCMMWPREWMELGDDGGADIEILHIYSCHSMTVDNNVHATTWRSSGNSVFQGIHQIHGFHGEAHAFMETFREPFENLANNGFSNAVAEEWVSELYAEDIVFEDLGGYGFWRDQCPVAYTGRDTNIGALLILATEQYDTRGNWQDITDPQKFKRLYVDGCRPLGANEM